MSVKKAALLFAVCAALVACTDNTEELRDYINSHVIPATVGGIAVADEAGWMMMGFRAAPPPDEVGSHDPNGALAIIPANERAADVPQKTVLKVTLNNQYEIGYGVEFSGGDAGLVTRHEFAGPSVLYVLLGPVNEARSLDITLRLIAPSGHKPPDTVRLPLAVAGKDYGITVAPSAASVPQGGTLRFYAAAHTFSLDSGVTWGLEPDGDSDLSDISIDAAGILRVGNSVPQGTEFRVTATPTNYPSRVGTAAVTVGGGNVSVNPAGATIERGNSWEFSVSGIEGGVEWSILGGSEGSSIDSDGLLTVGVAEPSMLLTIAARSKENPLNISTAVVKIPTVTGVSVLPSSATVKTEESLQFQAAVSGFELDAEGKKAVRKAVTWLVEGNKSTATNINIEDGLLSVAPNETATNLTVTATSAYEAGNYNRTAFFGMAMVSVFGFATTFSNAQGDPGSVIDAIAAAKAANRAALSLELPPGGEQVSFGRGEDLSAGLTLTADTSPAVVIIDGGGRVVDLTGSPNENPLITVGNGVTLTLRNIVFKGLKSGGTGDNGNNNASLIKVAGGTLVLEAGAVIQDNSHSNGNGGGVFVESGTLTMKSGSAISGNTASSGGGVYVAASGIFTMSGGTISSNTANGNGGGVYMDGSTFTMSGGAVVNQDNVVYLARGKRITVSNLTGSGPVAKIQPATMDGGTVVLEAAAGHTLQDTIDRFTLWSPGYSLYLDDNQGKISAPVSTSSGLRNAIAAASTTPVTITLTDDMTIASASDVITIDGGKHIKLVPGTARDITITRGADGLGSLFTVNNGASLTLEGSGGNELIIDGGGGNGKTATAALVRVDAATFTMNDGAVIRNNNNNSGGAGGGVHVVNGGSFAMSGGEISGNYANYNGGGVCVVNGGPFVMSGGEISGNYAGYNGGGVYADTGTFTMSGGSISGNTAVHFGGGVWVNNSGSFAKSGGTIYGGTGNNANTALSDTHAIAFVDSSDTILKKRSSTAGTGVNMDSSTAVGWE